MRLSNVALLDLPTGALHLLELPAVGPDGRELPVSFDQGRHIDEGDRPGSWMALSARLDRPFDRETIGSAWQTVAARHGALRTAFRRDDAGLHLHEVTLGEPVWHPLGPASPAALRAALDEACRPFARPAHRLALIEDDADPRPVVVFASDHAHVDMWSMIVLLHDLLEALGRGDADPTRPAPDRELPAPAAAFAEHTALLAAMPPADEATHAAWTTALDAGDGLMPRFPLPLGDLAEAHAERVEIRDVLDAAALARYGTAATDAGASILALTLSALAGAHRDLADAPLRAVFPVHSRTEARWRDAVGWFVTNAVLDLDGPDPLAAQTAFRAALRLGSVPLAPIFAERGGWPATPGMFAVSWLDARRMPIPVDGASDIRFVSAVIRTDGVMVWFIVGDDGVHLRCRYPDTPEAVRHVGAWLDAVVGRMQVLAAGTAEG